MTVTLRDVLPEDLPSFALWEQDAEFREQAGIERARTLETFQRNYAEHFLNPNPAFVLRTVCDVEGNPIGRLEAKIEQGGAHLGAVMGRTESRGRGLGSQAMQLFLSDVLPARGVTRAIAHIYEDNQRSLHFFEKHGFVRNGQTEEELFNGRTRVLLVLEGLIP